jgi:DNA ligase 1
MSPAPFSALAETMDGVRSTPGTLGKIDRLARYLATLQDADLRLACTYLTGSAFPPGDPRRLQVGWSMIADVLVEIAGATPDDLHAVYLAHGDLGDTAGALLERRRPVRDLFPRALSLESVADAFAAIAAAQGPSSRRAKRAELRRLLLDATPLEARFLAKILTADLRIGFREGLLLPAIAQAFGQAPQAVRHAALLLTDPGDVAVRARANTLAHVTLAVGSPFRFMLAGAIAAIDDAFRDGHPPMLVEDKYDGIRVQAHLMDGRIVLYSRTLEDISLAYPEAHAPLLNLGERAILDGEIVAWRGDRPLPFADLQRRLGRLTPGALLEEVPVVFVVFDLLHLDGRDLLEAPLAERRAVLQGLRWEGAVRLSSGTLVAEPAEAEARYQQAREAGHEGIVLKRWDAPYQPGRRGRLWIKWKPGLASLDVVVVAAEYGHGKRARVMSDYTFAVRDGERLVTIGKAYSGLTDAEIARLTEWFLEHTIEDLGRVRVVEPRIVLEVAFDRMMQSDRHTSGYALRFPRILRIREDKGPDEINTLDDVRAVFLRIAGPGADVRGKDRRFEA